MTKAKEKAFEAYPKRPEQRYITAYGTFEFDHDAPNREGFIKGYEQAEKDLGWHSVEESLPPIDEEVIVLTDVVNSDYPENKIDGANFMCFGHIVDPDAIVDVYGNPYKIVEYNGWNIPGVKYWMPMPKLPKEDGK